MKTLIATAILAMAIASPALAQRAQSAPQRGHQSQQNGYYNGYPVQQLSLEVPFPDDFNEGLSLRTLSGCMVSLLANHV